jgi:hypothetical protein
LLEKLDKPQLPVWPPADSQTHTLLWVCATMPSRTATRARQ